MGLADRVTVLRDGRHVVTAPIAEMSRSRLIAAMVGRERLAGAGAGAADAGAASVLSVRGLALDVPTRHGWRRVLDGVDFDAAPRRGARHRRAARLRPHRDPRDAVRRQRRPRAAARSRSTASRSRIALAARRPPPRPRAGHRGPQGQGAAPRGLDPRQRHAAVARRASRASASARRAGEARAAARRGAPARRPLHRHRAGGRDALRRQPAEGGDRQVARHRPARAAARRADPRHRRRRQAGDLRADPRPRPPRAWPSSWSAPSCRSCCCSPTASWSCPRAAGPACSTAPRRARRRSCTSPRPRGARRGVAS